MFAAEPKEYRNVPMQSILDTVGIKITEKKHSGMRRIHLGNAEKWKVSW